MNIGDSLFLNDEHLHVFHYFCRSKRTESMVLNLYSKGAWETQRDTHVWGKLPWYFHRYLDRSFEKITIIMDKQVILQGILITSLEGIIFTHAIVLEFHNGLALRPCA